MRGEAARSGIGEPARDVVPSAGAPDLVQRALLGERVAVARLLTFAERGGAPFAAMHDRLHERVGRARRIGITGPPGAGKSTLVEALGVELRRAGHTVGVIAVDPTSPFTGGALLGDRVRMNRLALDPGCFIRSMASRGAFGGLARGSDDLADVLDAVGYDRVLLETVGVGQSEVEVARAADATVVVLVPGAGDAVQAMKAGIMEVADVFVVNKADRPGADRVVAELEEMLQLRAPAASKDHGGEPPAIVRTVAADGTGVPELLERLDQRHAAAEASGELLARRRRRTAEKVLRLVEDGLRRGLFAGRGLEGRIAEALAQPGGAPYRIASQLLRECGLDDAEGRTT